MIPRDSAQDFFLLNQDGGKYERYNSSKSLHNSLEMPCFDLEREEFFEDSANGEPTEMTEYSPTSKIFQLNDNNSHDSEIECEVNNDSQELKDFLFAQQRSNNTVNKSPI